MLTLPPWLLPARDSLIKQLLYVRRAFRHRQKKQVLHSDGTDEHPLDSSTKRRRPAELPQHPPDVAPPFLPIILFIIAIIPRVAYISYPDEVVFDEVHFLRFIHGYYYGEYFFDIHPPLGKLFLYLVTYLFCGPPNVLEFNGEKFGKQKYVPVRLAAAIFGAAVSPLSYLICRQLGFSLPASLIPAFTLAFEHLSLIESRLVLVDSQLMAYMALTLLMALIMWSKPRGRRRSWVVATAVAGAMALSVKWTALVTPALIAIVSVIGIPFSSSSLLLSEMGLAAIVAFSLYTFFFAVHFALLPKSGQGDAFMTMAFQKSLKGGKFYQEGHRGPGFIRNFIYLNYEMFVANRGIKTRHHWESKWWQWMINQRGLLYFNHYSESTRSKIYLIVNPFVTVFTLMATAGLLSMILAFLVRLALNRGGKLDLSRRMRAMVSRGTFFLSAYILNLLPYIEVARCTFLYHYLPPLFYAILTTANLVNGLPSLRLQWLTSVSLCLGVFVAFWLWKPWVYASLISDKAHKWRALYGEKWE